jgi:hypothetical protein
MNQGKADASAASRLPHEPLDLGRIKQLVQLAHPDKHSNSPAANAATQWLLAQRRLLEAGK